MKRNPGTEEFRRVRRRPAAQQHALVREMKNSFSEAAVRQIEALALGALNEAPQISSLAAAADFNDALYVLADMTEFERELVFRFIGARVVSVLCRQTRGALAAELELARLRFPAHQRIRAIGQPDGLINGESG